MKQVRRCSRPNCNRVARDGEYWCEPCYCIAMKKVYRRKKREAARKLRKERLNESGNRSLNIQKA